MLLQEDDEHVLHEVYNRLIDETEAYKENDDPLHAFRRYKSGLDTPCSAQTDAQTPYWYSGYSRAIPVRSWV